MKSVGELSFWPAGRDAFSSGEGGWLPHHGAATTVTEALWLEACDVDIIIAQGHEAGGHRGTFLTHT
jgi:hypothetical protein